MEKRIISAANLTANDKNAVLDKKSVQQCKHYYCAAVERYAARFDVSIIKAWHDVTHILSKYAAAYGNTVCFNFFAADNEITAQSAYWLQSHYGCIFGRISDYIKKHWDTYNIIERATIDVRRFEKQNYNDWERLTRHNRRQICKLYRDNKYIDTIRRLNSEDWDAELPANELDELTALFDAMLLDWDEQFANTTDCYTRVYMLGVLQGRSENAALKAAR